jgi:soluble lytic murein transglycosylase-like protein
MFDTELAKHISRNSHLGLGELLYKSVTGESFTKAKTPATKPVSGYPGPPDIERRPVVSTDRPAPPPAPAVHVVAGDTVAQKVNVFEPLIQEAADKHGVDSNLLKAVMASESAGNALARSSKNAKGLMQLVDTTASAMGVRNVWNPRENIQGGAKYLQQLLERFGGNLEQAIASYNAGPGAVEKHGGIPPFKETREYVDRVMKYLHYFEQQPGASYDND